MRLFTLEKQDMLYRILTGRIEPIELAALLVALVAGITVHEFAHAAAATWLGDSLPRRQGRLSLSPAAHLDPMGSLMFLIGGFGWGKPVQYNPYALHASARTGPAIVAAAGPLSNILLATLVALIVRALSIGIDIFDLPSAIVGTLFYFLIFFIYYNLMLSFFNLIPVFPLDGFTILQGLLPLELADLLETTRPYGFFILLLLLFFGSSILAPILFFPINALMYILVGFGL
jgi:Zn-dependent protease